MTGVFFFLGGGPGRKLESTSGWLVAKFVNLRLVLKVALEKKN